MKLLLDTCTFLWAVSEPEKLSERARTAITEPANEVFVSAVSSWEICVKENLGGLQLLEPSPKFIPKYRALHGYLELPLDEASVFQLAKLPPIHKDPFDRMLICQAIAKGMTLVTPDPMIAQYPIHIVW